MYSKYHKPYDIHYVVYKKIKNVNQWIHIFDYYNLMLYLLDSNQNLSDKKICYVDKLYRSRKKDFIYADGIHELNKSKLILQGYEFEAKTLHKKKYNPILDINEFPSRKWHDLWLNLQIDESEWKYGHKGYFLPFHHRNHKRHRQGSYSVPKSMWRKVRFQHKLAVIATEYDEDYSQYLTHKRRYKTSEELGWWDDYFRRRKSAGWKESSKRKHQWKERG